MKNDIEILKASGQKEKFNKEKFLFSLKRAGVKGKILNELYNYIKKILYPGISTKEIFDKAFLYLKKENPVLAGKYKIKKAIMDLGPTGFIFENYVASILKEYNYQTKVDQIVPGFCVDYEIDILAEKENKRFLIECKYHNQRGIKTDVKTALYVLARFLDIQKAFKEKGEKNSQFNQAWLITNTKYTSKAIDYGLCVGLKLIGWHYPKKESLEELIERKKLYPITILPSLDSFSKRKFFNQGILLVKDILNYSLNDLTKTLKIHPKILKNIYQEAEKVLNF